MKFETERVCLDVPVVAMKWLRKLCWFWEEDVERHMVRTILDELRAVIDTQEEIGDLTVKEMVEDCLLEVFKAYGR